MLSIGTPESRSVDVESELGKREELRVGRARYSGITGSRSGSVLVRVTERDRSCVGR